MVLTLAAISNSQEVWGARVSVKELNDRLFSAVFKNNLALVRSSITAGANIKATNNEGLTAAGLAVEKGYFSIAHYILGIINQKSATKKDNTNFDGVISFQNLDQENILEHIEFYHNILKDKGILVLSVSNKKKNPLDHKENDKKFELKELKKIISPKFEIIDVFSQRFKEKPVINYKAVMFKTAKKKLASVLAKADKAKQFYQKNIKQTISKHDPYKEYFHKIPDDDFVPKKYQNSHNPLFLILICKKI